MSRIIGVTGPSGSGKSVLCKRLSDLGIPCINADEVYHSMLTPPSRCLDAIVRVFGADMLADDGSLNRSTLSTRVFSNPDLLTLLNETVLPIVIDRINELISELDANGAHTVVLDAPTLIESGFHKSCDMIIVITAPKADRIQRIMSRDGISKDHATKRVISQKDDDFYLSVADITLFNNKDEDSFLASVNELATAITTL